LAELLHKPIPVVTPDNRHGQFRDCDAFRQLFESVLRRCLAEGLVGGEGFAVDASAGQGQHLYSMRK